MKAVTKLLFSVLLIVISIPDALAIQTNNTYHVIRRASTDKINRYLNDKDFVYQREVIPTSNFWDKIERWIIEHLFSPIFKNQSVTLWDIFLYAIASVAVILIIYYFIKSDKVSLFSKQAGNYINVTSADENIHELDFDRLISGAIANSQYRIAIRFLYLKSLKNLSLKGLIFWKADKTNRDYINELRLSSFEKLFVEVTYLFDYVWYGNTDINETSFQNMKAAFDKFNIQIQSGK